MKLGVHWHDGKCFKLTEVLPASSKLLEATRPGQALVGGSGDWRSTQLKQMQM